MRGPIRVLLLEDRPDDAEMAVRELKRGGFAVTWACAAGRSEFLTCLEQPWDVILADYTLPHYNALEALEELRRSGIDTPVILVTGTLDDETAAACLRAGAVDFLHKDRMARLPSAVEYALDQQRLCREKQQADEALRASNQQLADALEELRGRNVELGEANRRLQQALLDLEAAQAHILAQERMRALGTMASGLAHDFDNSLHAILGFVDLMLADPSELADTDRVTRYLRLMQMSALDAAGVVRRMRAFYRPREDQDVFAPVGVKQLLEEVVLLTRPRWRDQAGAEGRIIAVESDVREVEAVWGVESELREALINLVFNAVDALPEGGRIRLSARRADGEAVVEVSDTGTGMAPEVVQRCLEPFFSTKGEQGTGLGLSMVHGIVRRHGGALEIDSAPDRGTVVRMRLPCPGDSLSEGFQGEAVKPA